MSNDLTQAQMKEMIFGADPKVEVVFYDKNMLDAEASHKAHQRIETPRVYLHLKCEKENSENHRPLQEVDKMRYPEQWKAYLRGKDNESSKVQDISAAQADCAGIEAKGY